MCTTIAERAETSGSAKGPSGWFTLDHVYVGYDHPVHAPLAHALSLDFVNEGIGPGARVAVELTREAARDLAERILRAVALAEEVEGDSSGTPAATDAL